MLEFDNQMTADEHVAHGEIYFRSLIEHGSDIISAYDANAIRLYTSPSIEHVLGYKPAELIGKSGFDLVHPDDRDEMSRFFASVVQTPGRVMTRELRCHHKDGSWRVLEATASNLLDKSAVASIVLNSRDITDRKKAEELLRHGAEQQTMLLRSVPITLYSVQPLADFATTWISENVEQVTGFAPEQFLTEPSFWAQRLHPDDMDRVFGQFHSVLTSGNEDMEYRWLCAD